MLIVPPPFEMTKNANSHTLSEQFIGSAVF